MEAAPRPHDDPSADAERPMPDEDPTEDAPDRRRRLPIPEFFTRRAFHSKDTGRWHNTPGGRDDEQGGPQK